jgi:hypothetical protein
VTDLLVYHCASGNDLVLLDSSHPSEVITDKVITDQVITDLTAALQARPEAAAR